MESVKIICHLLVRPMVFYPSCHQKRLIELGEWLSLVSIGNQLTLNVLILFFLGEVN